MNLKIPEKHIFIPLIYNSSNKQNLSQQLALLRYSGKKNFRAKEILLFSVTNFCCYTGGEEAALSCKYEARFPLASKS